MHGVSNSVRTEGFLDAVGVAADCDWGDAKLSGDLESGVSFGEAVENVAEVVGEVRNGPATRRRRAHLSGGGHCVASGSDSTPTMDEVIRHPIRDFSSGRFARFTASCRLIYA